MAKTLAFIFIIFSSLTLLAQFGPPQIISNSIEGVFKAYPYDMDKDGDMDVVTATYLNDSVSWFKNLDGLGTFGPESLITDVIVSLEDMQLFDVNGDNSKDIVIKNLANDYIVWLENLDDQGNFASAQIMYQGNYCYYFNMDDLDGDGDLDLIATLYSPPFDQKLVWFENTDGLGSFGAEQIILNEPSHEAQFSSTIDIDNDGDRDILLGYYFLQSSKLVWFENDGTGSFSESQLLLNLSPINSDFRRIGRTIAVDFDDDGYMDILYHTGHPEGTDNINWIRNIDGTGTFSNPVIIYEEEHFVDRSMDVFDLDQDGDLDILFSEGFNNKIYWIENMDSLGTFGSLQLITDELEDLEYSSAADFNGDGFLDIISASAIDGSVVWYEYGGLGTEDFNNPKILFSPNPARDWVQIHELREPLLKVSAITIDGKFIELPFDENTINLQGVSEGLYFIRLQTIKGAYHHLKLVVE